MGEVLVKQTVEIRPSTLAGILCQDFDQVVPAGH